MYKNYLKFISFGSLALLAVLLVVATIVERIYGATFYSSPYFVALWAVMLLSAVLYIFYTHVKRAVATLFLHLAFVVVLVGAFVTFLTGERGSLYLCKDAPPSSMFVKNDGGLVSFPFRVTLGDCRVVFVDGGNVPRDYVAELLVQLPGGENEIAILSMNHVYDREGFRFFLSNVEGESVALLVSHDPWGVPITYLGYFLVALGFLFLFASRKTQMNGLRLLLKTRGNTLPCNASFSRKITILILSLCLFGSVTYQGVCRWVDTGLFPVSNGAEVLMFIAWCSSLSAIVLLRKNGVLALGTLCLSALCAVVALLSGAASSGAVPPVLRTPLLPLHVVTIAVSYLLIGLLAVNSLVALSFYRLKRDHNRLESAAASGRLLLYFATFLLVVGMFLGAVWANISWGRYWGWDPKEVWALVTLVVCSFGFHTRSLPFMARPLVFHYFCLVLFFVALFTYLGVNLLFGGLHAYA